MVLYRSGTILTRVREQHTGQKRLLLEPAGHQEKAEKAESLDIRPHLMFRMRSSSDLPKELEQRKLQVKCPK